LTDESEVVGHKHHTALKLINGFGEGVDCFHVKMVRRLIQKQQMWLNKKTTKSIKKNLQLQRKNQMSQIKQPYLFECEPSKYTTRLLSIGQVLNWRQLGFASDAEATNN
jgi:hypothetical protein